MGSGLSESPDFSDVVNTDYKTASVAVGTTEVEAKVGGSPLSKRQILTLLNEGAQDIFYGPTGLTSSTGTRLRKNQFASIPAGDCISIFMLTATSTATVIVQEFS